MCHSQRQCCLYSPASWKSTPHAEQRGPRRPPAAASCGGAAAAAAAGAAGAGGAAGPRPREGRAARHLVRLERRPGAERLGFGNVVAGPAAAPVLLVSWIREGALEAWNRGAPEGLAVPPQSAILSVNGVCGDAQQMREQLRESVVEMEVVAPDRWRYAKVVGTT